MCIIKRRAVPTAESRINIFFRIIRMECLRSIADSVFQKISKLVQLFNNAATKDEPFLQVNKNIIRNRKTDLSGPNNYSYFLFYASEVNISQHSILKNLTFCSRLLNSNDQRHFN